MLRSRFIAPMFSLVFCGGAPHCWQKSRNARSKRWSEVTAGCTPHIVLPKKGDNYFVADNNEDFKMEFMSNNLLMGQLAINVSFLLKEFSITLSLSLQFYDHIFIQHNPYCCYTISVQHICCKHVYSSSTKIKENKPWARKCAFRFCLMLSHVVRSWSGWPVWH